MSESIENLMNTEMARPRRIGYTTSIATVAKHHKGTVLCGNRQIAKQLIKDHGVKAVSVQDNLRGATGPYFWDSTAFATTYVNIEKELKSKQHKIEFEKSISDRAIDVNVRLTQEINELKLKNRWLHIYNIVMAIAIGMLVFMVTPNASAYEVNAYQATEKDKTVLEIVDDCNKSYKLLVKTDELGTKKTLNWFETILSRSDFCLDK